MGYVVTLVAPLLVAGAERIVLCEEFMSSDCPYSYYAGRALGMMLNNYPETFVLVQIHLYDNYETTWGSSRCAFYDSCITPTAVFDGVSRIVGTSADINEQYDTYEQLYLQRQVTPTDMTIELEGRQVGGTTFAITATACMEDTGTARVARLYLVHVLNYWPADAANRNGFRQATVTEDLALVPGRCDTILKNFTFDSTSWINSQDIKIVAWLQEPVDCGPAEVYQAAVMGWPFPVPDCNHNGVADTMDISGSTSDDCDGNNVPDECEPDFDTDGRIDACDPDEDDDGLLDDEDACPRTPLNTPTQKNGSQIGDVEPDCDIDLADFSVFAACLDQGGPGAPADSTCVSTLDFDDDDVDLEDFARFQTAVNIVGRCPSGWRWPR